MLLLKLELRYGIKALIFGTKCYAVKEMLDNRVQQICAFKQTRYKAFGSYRKVGGYAE